MDLAKQRNKKKNDLKRRVLSCRSSLIAIGVKRPMDKFAIKFPEFAKNERQITRLNNLWYNKITDDDFTKKLELFVEFKKNEY